MEKVLLYLLLRVTVYIRSVVPVELRKQVIEDAEWCIKYKKNPLSRDSLNQSILAALRYVVIDMVRRGLL